MATTTAGRRRTETLRDAAVALAVLLGTYALGSFGFPPGYFLVAAADVLQASWPGTTPNFGVALAAVCGVLAVAAVGVASLARSRRDAPTGRWWAGGVGGSLGVLGLLALGFAAAFLVGAMFGPAAIAGATGAILVAVAVALFGD